MKLVTLRHHGFLSGRTFLAEMMEEMAMVTACDARAIEEMSEEEILACLVAETEPTFTVRHHTS